MNRAQILQYKKVHHIVQYFTSQIQWWIQVFKREDNVQGIHGFGFSSSKRTICSCFCSVIIYLIMYIKKANTRFTLAPRIAFKVYGPFRQMEHVSKELFLFKLGKSQAPFEIIKVISSFVYLFYVPIISFIFKRQQQL